MRKLILLYATFVVGLLFMVLPETVYPKDYFLFSDMKLHFATYIYFICERLVLVVLAYVVASEATKYREAIWIFFFLLCVDVVDFLLTYNSVWFYVRSFPVSMNTTKSIVFGLVIIRELWNRSTGR